MKILEFVTDRCGKLSSSRLFMLLITITFVTEWQHHIWTSSDPFTTSIEMLIMVTGTLGFKIFNNKTEAKK